MTGLSKLSQVKTKQPLGVAAGLLSAASYGAMSLVIHVTGTKLPSTEMVFYRDLFAVIVLMPFALRDMRALKSHRAAPVWLRGVFGAASILCYTWNLSHTSIGMANVLFGFAPLGVLIFAWMAKSEPLTVKKVLSFLLIVAGGFVFYAGPMSGGGMVILVGLSGALAAALSYTTLKRAAHWSPWTLTWALSLTGLPVALIAKRGPWPQLNHQTILPLISVAILCLLGEALVALSYRWAALSTATGVAQSTMAFGVLFDVIRGTQAGVQQLIACAIYLAGCIPLMIMKADPATSRRQEDSPVLAPITIPISKGEV